MGDDALRADAIAIVGMACRFPGADDPSSYWRNLKDGIESIDREWVDARGEKCVIARGKLRSIEAFDAAFFDFTPREASVADPQLRVALECAWAAFEDAGYVPAQADGLVGVYMGASLSSYLLRYLAPSLDETVARVGGATVLLHNDKDFIPTTIAHRMNLRGPCVNVSSACSTSLVAVQMACQGLLTEQCDMALAGGVSLHLPQDDQVLPEVGGIYALDGVCRAYDARAAGTVGGSGAGLVVLKRARDALTAGDFIYAIILGGALNNDGSDKLSFAAPSISGQSDCIEQALANAGVAASEITLLEGHGTGTPLGDEVELAALRSAFRSSAPEQGFCALGSVKTNIGHLDAAAGVAGLMKVALALRHRTIPPSLHFECSRADGALMQSQFYVPSAAQPWPVNVRRPKRRAGVSAFGVGGTNAHLVLEESPPRAYHDPRRALYILPISARTRESVANYLHQLCAHLRSTPDLSLADAAFTLAVGRAAFHHRIAFVCRDASELEESAASEAPLDSTPWRGPLVFAFPAIERGDWAVPRAAWAAEPDFREVVRDCWRAVESALSRPLEASLLRLFDHDLPADEHPLLQHLASMASAYALARLWMSWGAVPEALVGDGEGLLLAAALSGLLTVQDAFRIAAGAATIDQVGFCRPVLPVRSRNTGTWLTAETAAGPAHWSCSEDADREWVRALPAEREGRPTFVTFGGAVSDGIVACPVAHGLEQGQRALYSAFAQGWKRGIHVDWQKFYAGERRTRVPLPSYAFERQRHWVSASAPSAVGGLRSDSVRGLTDLSALEAAMLADASRTDLSGHPGLERELDSLCVSLLVRYLADAQIAPRGEPYSRNELCQRLGILPQFSRFLDFVLRSLEEEGLAAVTGDLVYMQVRDDAPSPEAMRESISLRYPAFVPLADLLSHCAAGYRFAFSDLRAGLRVLYEDGTAKRLREAFGQIAEHSRRSVYVQIARAFVVESVQRAAGNRPLRILEAGAGAGLLTSVLVEALAETACTYHVTDVARGFLLEMRERMQIRGAIDLHFRLLDIDAAPEGQGFEPGTYDLIVGLDAVHAARDVVSSLTHLKSLLAPGGTLCIVEAVRARRWDHMLWGLTEGWWRYQDALREDSPLLKLEGWETACRRAGFRAITALPDEPAVRAGSDYGIVFARKDAAAVQHASSSVPPKRPDVTDWFYVPVWKRALSLATVRRVGPFQRWLVARMRGDSFGSELVAVLRSRGECVISLIAGDGYRRIDADQFEIDPRAPAQHDALIAELDREASIPQHIVHLWSLGSEHQHRELLERLASGADLGLHALLFLAQALGRAGITQRIHLTSIHDHVQDVGGESILCPEKSTLIGALKLIPQEYPNIHCSGLDIVLPAAGSPGERRLITRCLSEAEDDSSELFAAYRGDQRWVPAFEPVRFPPVVEPLARVRSNGVYLITGGRGGIGLEIATYLARTGRCKLALVGRSQFPARERWEQIARSDEDALQSSVARKLIELEQHAGELLLFSADAAVFDEMLAVVAEVEARLGPINGVIHSVVVPDTGGVIQNRTRETVEEAMAGKVRGAVILDDLLRARELDFFVVCSALGVVLHQLKTGEVGYVAANEFLDAFARYRSARSAGLTVSINWTDWLDVGLSARAMQQYLSKHRSRLAQGVAEHPLLGAELMDASNATTFVNLISPEQCWVLDGHRIAGVAVLPGTAYVELAYAAFVHKTGARDAELSDVSLVSPLAVPDGSRVELHTTLRADSGRFVFTVESRIPGENRWTLHASGHIQHMRETIAHVEELSVLRRRPAACSLDFSRERPPQSDDTMRFGERWDSIRTVRYDVNWGLAELALASNFAASDSFQLHPAILDCAFSFLCPYILKDEKGLYMPTAYERIRVRAPASPLRELVAVAETPQPLEPECTKLAVNVRLAAPDGAVWVDATGLTLQKVLSHEGSRVARNRPRNYTLDIERPGQLDTLRFVPVVTPSLGPGDVEIEIAAAALNFKDVLVALGKLPAIDPAYKFGLEASGRITQVGSDVGDFAVGDSVMTFGVSWSSPRVVVPAAWVARMPEHLSWVQAAAVPVAFTIAQLALGEIAQLHRGESVLIHCAAGGVGFAAMQIARKVGARVYATAGSADKREFVSRAGAEAVFDSRSASFAAQLRTATGGAGVHVVLNSLAGQLAHAGVDVLAEGGRFVELGFASLELQHATERAGKRYSDVRLDPRDPKLSASWQRVTRGFAERRLEPLPVRALPIRDLSSAFEIMATAQHIGRIVVSYDGWPDYELDFSSTHSNAARVRRLEVDYVSNLVQGHSRTDGIDVFGRILQQDYDRVLVSTQNLDLMLAQQRVVARVGPQAFLDMQRPTSSSRARPALNAPVAPTVPEIEGVLTEIWKDLLGLEHIGADDDFFDIGGDSLVAIRVLSRCSDAFQVDQTLTSLFDHPTIAKLALKISSLQAGQAATANDARSRERLVL